MEHNEQDACTAQPMQTIPFSEFIKVGGQKPLENGQSPDQHTNCPLPRRYLEAWCDQRKQTNVPLKVLSRDHFVQGDERGSLQEHGHANIVQIVVGPIEMHRTDDDCEHLR